MDVIAHIRKLEPKRQNRARTLVAAALGSVLTVGYVAFLPLVAQAAVTEFRTPLTSGVESPEPLVVSGATVISGSHRSTNGGASWVAVQALSDVRASGAWWMSTTDTLAGFTYSGGTAQAVTYDVATGSFHSYPTPWSASSVSASWILSDVVGPESQPYVTAYDFVTGTSVTANSPAGYFGWPDAELAPTGAILWWGYDTDFRTIVASGASPSATPSAWVALEGKPADYAISATELTYVIRGDLTAQVCVRPLAALDSVTCSGSVLTPVGATLTLCDFGASSIVNFQTRNDAMVDEYQSAIWNGSWWATVALPTGSRIGECSPRASTPVTPVMYAEVRDANDIPSIKKVAPDGSVSPGIGLPPAPARPAYLRLAWDRIVGLDGRDGSSIARTAWSRPVSSAGFDTETLFPERPYELFASAGRTALVQQGASLYERGVRTATLAIGMRGMSGPYLMEPIFSPMSVKGWTIYDVSGRTVRTLPVREAALFGSVFVSWASSSPSSVMQQLLVADVESKVADRYVDVPAGLVCSTSGLEVWGEYLAAYCGTDVDIISLVDGHLVRSMPGVTLFGMGDGYVVVGTHTGLTYEVTVRSFAGATLGTISGCSDVVATDGMGHVACATATELVWQEYPVTAPGRVLGWVAPSSFSTGSWVPEIDVTRSFQAGVLRISQNGSVVRELAVPASADGSLRGVSWDGKNTAGTFVTGVFTAELLVAGPDGAAVKAIDGVSAPTFQVSRLAPGSYVALSPTRLLDTRDGTGAMRRPVAANEVLDLQVTGRGGIPVSGVGAVILNVTAVTPTGPGYLSVYPTGAAVPNASNLNFTAGQVVPNLVVAKVGAGGKVSIKNSSPGVTEVVADVAGYFADGTVTDPGGLTAVTPSRLLDTRDSSAVASGGSVVIQATGRGGVPASGVSSVVVNLTAVTPTGSGFLTAYPTGGAVPNASNVNFTAGQVVPNLAFVKLAADGSFTVKNSSPGATHVVADVAGYVLDGEVTGSGMFVPLSPTRVLDTRPAYGGSGAVGANAVKTLTMTGAGGVPSTGVSGVVLNVTAVASAAGFLTVYPADVAAPNASNVNFTAGQVVPNLASVKTSAAGAVALRNVSPGATNVIADVAGYFTS